MAASTASVPPHSGLLQRKCACGGTPGPTGECAGCRRSRLLGGPLQAKLRVGQPDDQYEREADRIADQVMRMPEPGLQRQVEEEEEDEELLQAKPLVQRRSPVGEVGSEAPPIVHEVLRSPGRPLDPQTRAFMGPRFGYDFGQVRVHTDAKSARSARAVNALAYTVGQDVVFGGGQFSPGTAVGKKLLVHELMHTLQQISQSKRFHACLTVNSPGGVNELETEQGLRVPVHGSSIPSVSQITSPTVQRIIGTDEEFGQTPSERRPSGVRSGEPLPFREATELLECLRLMGNENATYCREVVLGAPPPGPVPIAPPCTPRPVASLDEFRNADGSNTSAENCCPICPVPLGVGAGGQARHGMQMRIMVTNPCPAAYEITRVRETWLW